MNNRQKAKHFKKLYEMMKNTKVDGIIFPTGYKKLNVRQTVEASYLNQLSAEAECPYTYVKNALVRNLSEQLVRHTIFHIEPSYIPDHVDITATIEIIENKGSEVEDDKRLIRSRTNECTQSQD